MPTELHRLLRRNLQDLLEATTNTLEASLALQAVCAFVFLALWRLAGGPRPETHTPESLPDVDNDPHHLVVTVVFQCLADGGEEEVQPSLVVGLRAFESIRPATTVLVLRILPLWAYATLEEVVVGLLCELGGRCDVVL